MAPALVIFKPDAAYRLAVRRSLQAWMEAQTSFRVEGLRWFQAPAELIESHYDFLRDRPFFPWLVDFMTALPVLVGRIEGEPDALEQLRYELGETRIQEARPGSLRERFGIYGGINCLHVSDSPETGERETAAWAQYVEFTPGTPELGEGEEAPDHTFHLRSLAAQIVAGTHADLAGLEIQKLLKEETGLDGDRFEAFQRIILGALG